MRSQRNRLFGLAVVLVAGARAVYAQEDIEDEGDGSEARALLPTKIDDLIEVSVRLNPDLTRARLDRSAARDTAIAARRGQAWVLTASVQGTRSSYADQVDVPLFSPLGQTQIGGSPAPCPVVSTP